MTGRTFVPTIKIRPINLRGSLGKGVEIIKSKKTHRTVVLFLKKNPRIINFGTYLLILAAFGFIIAGFQELSTLKVIGQSRFLHHYCSYNFPHHYNNCMIYMRNLAFRYIYDAGRFFLIPVAILYVYGLYKVRFEEPLQAYIKSIL